MRTYVFCGDASRCVRVTSTHPVVKGDSVVDVYEVDIPPEVVELRRSLNFDYGKFDFVMTPEGPKVFDFNKTPSSVSTSTPELQEIVDIGNETFADALERMVH